MITVYYYDRKKIKMDVVGTVQEAYELVRRDVWLKSTATLNKVYFVHRTSKNDEVMIEIKGSSNYYLLKADDNVNKQELNCVADCWRDGKI